VFICTRSIKLFYKRITYEKFMNLKNEYLGKNVTVSSFDACLNYVCSSNPYSTSSLIRFIYCCVDHRPRSSFIAQTLYQDSSTIRSSHSWVSACHNRQTTVTFLAVVDCLFALFLHSAYMMLPSSFVWPMHRMFYFNSAHLGLQTDRTTPWHTTISVSSSWERIMRSLTTCSLNFRWVICRPPLQGWEC
jgi:hypothetical protein